MTGVDAGPGTSLGTVGWFTGAWAVMMAAMMLPALAPAAAAYATERRLNQHAGGAVTALVLTALSFWKLIAPRQVPGLMVPASRGAMHAINAMH